MSTLPDGHLACLACGVPVSRAVTPEILTFEPLGREGQPVLATEAANRWRPVQFARCAPCEELRQQAHRLVAEHPRIVARAGNVAPDRMDRALSALAALGQPIPDHLTEQQAAGLLRHLAVPGALARWMARFVPVMLADANPAQAAEWPWAHVTDEQRQALRAGWGAVLAERRALAAPPVALPCPPPLHGCLMCGIGQQEVPAIAVQRAGGIRAATERWWTPIRAPRTALGGLPHPEPVEGHLCRPCARAVEHVGSVGPTAMTRSLREHLAALGDGRLAAEPHELDGMVGWAALGRAVPNPRPWLHVILVDA